MTGKKQVFIKLPNWLVRMSHVSTEQLQSPMFAGSEHGREGSDAHLRRVCHAPSGEVAFAHYKASCTQAFPNAHARAHTQHSHAPASAYDHLLPEELSDIVQGYVFTKTV